MTPQTFANSPYLPQQWEYNGTAPLAVYGSFVSEAGCSDITDGTAFECLVAQDTDVLQNASYTVTINAKYGQWAFLPVTDGKFVQQRPSVQLTTGPINGNRGLIGVCIEAYIVNYCILLTKKKEQCQ